ncbi:Hypothetical protein AKI40_4295 [Enterobacter sp. FY-07]|nr:Hypothetical protein AKI40_4295 [Enterobacter sp. FY-07]
MHQFQLITQLLRQVFTHRAIEVGVIQPFNNADFLDGVPFTGLIEVGFVFIKMVNALEQFAAANGPRDRRTCNLQLIFHFIQQLHRIADVTVKFVHKRQDRRVAQTGDFHQLTRPVFNAFCGINHHQTAVHCRQRTVGILGEVFVPGGIQQVNETGFIRELHYGGGNGNTTLLFHLHPVGFCMLAGTTAFYRTGSLDRLSEQQHLFSDGGFTSIGVRDDSERTALRHLLKIRRQRHNENLLCNCAASGHAMKYEKCGYCTQRLSADNQCLHRRCSSSVREVTVQVGLIPSGKARSCAFNQQVDSPALFPPRMSDSAVSPTINTRARSGLPACCSA